MPTDYAEGAELDVFALNIASTRVKLPFDYFSLPFCKPRPYRVRKVKQNRSDALGLGQILMGERARVTAYEFRMKKDVSCAVLCTQTLDSNAIRLIGKRISQGFRARLMLDNMPVVVRSSLHASDSYSLGHLIGEQKLKLAAHTPQHIYKADLTGKNRSLRDILRQLRDREPYVRTHIFNHLDFVVYYHVPDDLESVAGSSDTFSSPNAYRVVGFEVTPRSIKYPLVNPPSADQGGQPTDPDLHCISSPGTPQNGQAPMRLNFVGSRRHLSKEKFEQLSPGDEEALINKPQQIKYTYSVRFVESSVKWVTRFDPLFKVSRRHHRIQWFSVINSLMLAIFITSLFAIVLLRTLRRDCLRYGFVGTRRDSFVNDLADDFESDSGWKMLKGDVFRPPRDGGLLSVFCGSGIQLSFVVAVSVLFSLLGIISPSRRGQLLTALIFLWALSSSVAGYVAAVVHRAIGGVRWRLVTLGVALLLPGVAFSVFLMINIFMWFMGSIGAAPFVTLFSLLLLWLGISVPLAFAGTYVGYACRVKSFTVRTNQIPRQIPPQPAYLAPVNIFLVGLLPFGIVGIELRILLNSILQHEFYHMFAFLFAVMIILAVTCAEASVVLTYLRLANEDWRWWWPSFWASGSSGIYVFMYSLHTLATSPGADATLVVSNFLFVAYSALFSLCFTLSTGAIGCLSSLAFVRRIYSVANDD